MKSPIKLRYILIPVLAIAFLYGVLSIYGVEGGQMLKDIGIIAIGFGLFAMVFAALIPVFRWIKANF